MTESKEEQQLPPEPGEVLDPYLGLEGDEEPLLAGEETVDWPTEVNDLEDEVVETPEGDVPEEETND